VHPAVAPRIGWSAYARRGIPQTDRERRRLKGRRNLGPFEAISMLRLALLFLLVSVIAGSLGFTGVAGAALGLARVLIVVLLALVMVLVVAALAVGPDHASARHDVTRPRW
jgi:uncharacterized membrane protein YtjA (UPF0391 family)